jgi:hypothetical protein
MATFGSIPILGLAALLFASAFALGVAIQHGTICAVRAMSEVVRDRKADDLLGFFECGLWALLAAWLLIPDMAIPQWQPMVSLCLGAALFGAGATINGGCAFGSIARLGEGKAEYLLTGAGAYLAFRLLETIGLGAPTMQEHAAVPENALLFVLFGLPGLILLRFALWKRPIRVILRLSFLMAVIGTIGTFVGVLHQPWPWMLVLREIGTANWLTCAASIGLISGSIANGLFLGRFKLAPPRLSALPRRFAGGLMMGAGGALIPGGNDSLILQGVPSGDPLAFLAYGILLATIAALLLTVPRFNVH